jgi:hypothetical protein
MVERGGLYRGSCIAAVLSLLFAVMASPLQPQDSGIARSYLLAGHRDFAATANPSNHLAQKSTPPRTTSIKAVQLDCDDETPIPAAPPKRPSCVHLFSSSLKLKALASYALGPISTSRPLRC